MTGRVGGWAVVVAMAIGATAHADHVDVHYVGAATVGWTVVESPDPTAGPIAGPIVDVQSGVSIMPTLAVVAFARYAHYNDHGTGVDDLDHPLPAPLDSVLVGGRVIGTVTPGIWIGYGMAWHDERAKTTFVTGLDQSRTTAAWASARSYQLLFAATPNGGRAPVTIGLDVLAGGATDEFIALTVWVGVRR